MGRFLLKSHATHFLPAESDESTPAPGRTPADHDNRVRNRAAPDGRWRPPRQQCGSAPLKIRQDPDDGAQES